MNRFYTFLLLSVFFISTAHAQRKETLMHYVTDLNYTIVGVQQYSILFSRFETTAPCRITRVSLVLINQSATKDSATFVMFRGIGGTAFPWGFMLMAQTLPILVNPNVSEGIYNIDFNPPITLDSPTSFFVGIQKIGQNANLKMDNVSQTPSCISTEGDTMITSGWAVSMGGGRWAMGYKFTSGNLANNFYVSVDVEYFNEAPSTFFVDATAIAALDAPTLARRMAWSDYDKDGYQDVIIGDKLYHNKKDGTFEDVGAAIGFAKGSAVSMFADFDNDDDLDIICQPDNIVYVNNNGIFSAKASTGLLLSVNTRSMAIADYDGDKYPDVFVGNGDAMYAKNPSNPNDSSLAMGAGFQARLYKGNGDCSFADKATPQILQGYSKTTNIGLNPYTRTFNVAGYRDAEGAQWCDFDNDGDMDLLVSTGHDQGNMLFINQGNLKFVEQSIQKGLQGATRLGTNLFGDVSGNEWADYNNDGNMDLLIANPVAASLYASFEKTALYKNNGAPNYTFTDQQPQAKIEYNESHADVAWGDFNNDGLPDFYITSSDGCHNSALYQQNPDNSFTDVTYASGTKTSGGWGVTWVDYDNDGDLDLAVISDAGFQLFRNEVNNGNSWAEFLFKSISANDYAIGTRVTVKVGGKQYTREVSAGKGAGCQNPYTVHFGLDITDVIDEVTIRWPKGNIEKIQNAAVRKISTIVEKPAGKRPIIFVQQTKVDFGSVYISQNKVLSVTVRNSGDDTLHITEQTIENNQELQFSITQASNSFIAPSAQSDIKVKFQPTSPGLKTARLKIGSNDAQNPIVYVDLNGTPLTGVKENPITPTVTMLYQNYPNPFGALSAANSSSTDIRYDVATESDVTIKIYDALGIVVDEIVHASHTPGSYTASFDAGNDAVRLPSGMYNAVMEVKTMKGISRFTKSMLLVR